MLGTETHLEEKNHVRWHNRDYEAWRDRRRREEKITRGVETRQKDVKRGQCGNKTRGDRETGDERRLIHLWRRQVSCFIKGIIVIRDNIIVAFNFIDWQKKWYSLLVVNQYRFLIGKKTMRCIGSKSVHWIQVGICATMHHF